MTPGPGQHGRRFVGDRMLFTMRDGSGRALAQGWRALLRTNLGRADILRAEILHAHAKGVPFAGTSWRDIPMLRTPEGWRLDLALSETGYFKAKAYLLDPRGWQHWPHGPDFGLSVHPNCCRTGNTIYCAFPRLFGAHLPPLDAKTSSVIRSLDTGGYAVIPPSGKLRDLTRALPHITERLNCRILHLLPVNPVPTTYARFGTFGSPYAALDLAAIDPALTEFDKRSTGVDQFCELTYAAHSQGARVLLDIVVNHTGWGSNLQENHPEWFLRKPDGQFKSPGAWGVTWEDLIELNHNNPALWDALSEVFLTWCRRGVDGFRCDAGYMVPTPAWQYIIARVQQEFPNTLFLLEGLGGAWEATQALLTEGGMQWAYSELFQNYSSPELPRYLSHSIEKSRNIGVLVHYSETHDNDRLALRGRAWSLLRNRLCALASDSGAFGFTCGVEWLAAEKVRVHGKSSMNWGAEQNIIHELGRLNELLANHPCFFDGAKIEQLSSPDSPVLALLRTAEDSSSRLLVLVNTDPAKPHTIELPGFGSGELSALGSATDLLDQPMPSLTASLSGLKITLAPAAVHCIGADVAPGHGEAYRAARARAALAIQALSHRLPIESIGPMPWKDLAQLVDRDPARFLGAVLTLNHGQARENLAKSLEESGHGYLAVLRWSLDDCKRIVPVPPNHWVLVENPHPFRARFSGGNGHPLNLESTPVSSGHIAVIPPAHEPGEASLQIEVYDQARTKATAALRFLPSTPTLQKIERTPYPDDLILLTNGRGGMARIPIDLGRINSKYDCALGANLHPDVPVDRHVFVKRIRAWVNADGFISPLNASTLAAFEAGPPAVWHFVAPAGDGRTVQVDLEAAMVPDRNATVFSFSRPNAADATGKQLPAECDVRLIVRVDIEDRNFHQETHRNPGTEHHFRSHIEDYNSAPRGSGFSFAPAGDRRILVVTDQGTYHPQEEWSHLSHPVEASRGQVGHGDSFSPGWFEIPLPKGSSTKLTLCAEPQLPNKPEITAAFANAGSVPELADSFERALVTAARAFVVRRGENKTVIAGYPWFLDWGRDTFIAARGLISAGWVKEVLAIVRVFAGFEVSGTLPNTIHGQDASNRDTSDAPLWLAVLCEDLLGAAPEGIGRDLLSQAVETGGRTLREVLESIADNYFAGTPNGIRVDSATALVWSPSHFTWMDTNYPAGTPREGYPVEIQALWIRMLRFLATHGSAGRRSEWADLATRAGASVEQLFWLPEKGYYSDVLLAPSGKPANEAVQDDALRSNACFLVSLGISTGERARSTVAAAARHLVVPGALRSLAPLPVSVPLPVRDSAGNLLNNPHAPYRGSYEGDEDTSRKPAYHNGTAWVWTFPSFCEALARAWDFSPVAVAAAKAYLGSTEALLETGCIGQLPEIIDGDAPHKPRGCDAQAWSVTETLRVWLLLKEKGAAK